MAGKLFCKKFKANMKAIIEGKFELSPLSSIGNGFLFFLCFLPAFLSFGQVRDKKEVEAKLLQEARRNI